MYEDFKLHLITTTDAALKAGSAILRKAEATGERVAYDEEDDDGPDGKRVLLCVGACIDPKEVYCFVLDHPDNKASAEDKAVVKTVLQRLVGNPHRKVMQHGCHDAGIFKRLLGTTTKGFDWDSQYGSYMEDPSQRSYSLTSIVARKYPKYTDYKEFVQEAVPEGHTVEDGRDMGEFHLAKVPLEKMARYNGMDCRVTKLIERDVHKKVSAPLVSVYTDASFILDGMEKFGPLYDEPQAEKLLKIYPHQKKWYENKVQLLAGNSDLNLNSPKQMSEVIYETWRLPQVSRKRSTDKETIAILMAKRKHQGLEYLTAYRLVKNKIERIEAFKRSALAHLGRVTTLWWLTGTRTGRLSSGGGTRPDKKNWGNLQNIPREDSIMNMLVSDGHWRDYQKMAAINMKQTRDDKGNPVWVVDDSSLKRACHEYHTMDWFVAADYSQMELRVLAHVTGEQAMLDMFSSGVDIHAAIGSLWSGYTVQQLIEDEDKRTSIKRFHFGIIYGLTPSGLQKDLLAAGIRLPITTVEGYYTAYFDRFKKVRQYITAMPEFARNHGYVENLFGFKVPINVTEDHEAGASFWQNQSVNAPIQGAAHQVLLCCLALMKRNPEKYVLIRPQMEIHDALIGVTPFERMRDTLKCQQQLMENDVVDLIRKDFGIKWTVPLQADPKIGFRFGGLVKVKDNLGAAVKKAVALVPKQEADLAALYKQYGQGDSV